LVCIAFANVFSKGYLGKEASLSAGKEASLSTCRKALLSNGSGQAIRSNPTQKKRGDLHFYPCCKRCKQFVAVLWKLFLLLFFLEFLFNFNYLKNIRLFLICFFYLLCANVFAQSNHAFTQSISLSTKDGLSSNNVYAFCQDHFGVIWIATDAGITRYDGVHCKQYSSLDGLPDNEIIGLAAEKNGTVWASTLTNQLVMYNPKLDRFVESNFLEKIRHQDSLLQSYLYIAPMCDNGINAIFQKVQFKIVDQQVKDVKKYSDHFGQIELGFKNKNQINLSWGKISKENSELKLFSNQANDSLLLNYSSFDILKSFFYSNDHLLIFGISNLYHINVNQKGTLTQKLIQIPMDHLISYGCIKDDWFIYISKDEHVRILDLKTHQIIYKSEKIPLAKSCFLASNGILFVGTQVNGVLMFKPPNIQKIELSDNANNGSIISLQMHQQHLYIGNNQNEIIYLQNAKPIFVNRNGSNKESVHEIYSTPYGLLECADGSSTLNNKYLCVSGLPYSINGKAACIASDSIAYIGTHQELYQLHLPSATLTRLNKAVNRVSCLQLLTSNQLMIGTSNGLKMFDLQKNSLSDFNLNQSILKKRINALYINPQKIVFVGTADNGLIVIYQNKIIAQISLPQHLLHQHVICIKPIDDKRILIGTKKGLSQLSYQFNPEKFTYTIQNKFLVDGQSKLEVLSLLVSKDSIYAGTNRGLYCLPKQFAILENNLIPHLLHCKINQRDTIVASNYQLSNNQKDIQLQFSVTDFEQQFLCLKYKLDDDDWIQLNDITLNMRLNNGTHRLQIAAFNINGVQNPNPLILLFDIQTPFYLSTWFWVLMGILAVLAFQYFFYRQKINRKIQQMQQQQALDKQRLKITADLHDDIGSSLSSIQVNSNVANQLLSKNKEEDARKVISRIENQAQEVSDKIGNMIWSIKPVSENQISLSGRIKQIAYSMLADTGMTYQLLIDPRLDNIILDFTKRKNIILICKEAINNIIKYSKSSTASISLQREEGSANIILQIMDNGIGFDTNVASGNGLGNMQRRAAEMNGQFTIDTALGKGTKIEIVFVPE
jgi:signal transduction histidine kinase/ligand-binding sensor domain-containing protein